MTVSVRTDLHWSQVLCNSKYGDDIQVSFIHQNMDVESLRLIVNTFMRDDSALNLTQ